MAQKQQQQHQLPSDSVSQNLDSDSDDPLRSSSLPPTAAVSCAGGEGAGGGGVGSSSDPILSRSLSNSRLNARAPEFVPRSNSSSSPPTPTQSISQHQQQPHRIHVIAQPQQAGPGLVPVYTAPNYLPVTVPVVQNHHHPPYGHHVPPPPVPIQYHHHHHHHHRRQNHHHHRQHYGGGGGVGIVDQQEVGGGGDAAAQASQGVVGSDHGVVPLKNGLSEEAIQKLLNQVEYYFSDLNLATTDHLMRYINKDAEGYVPISVVASFKKIKALISSNSQLASILRNSAKLVVSEDGKKVRRQHLLTEADMEELQSRIVVAENLPDDHCHQNLMKIFSTVGSVKTIRTCQPQSSNGGASSASRMAKSDGVLVSNKLHAFVEYDSVELAEKAVVDLNEEDNWRNGLRVRLMLKHTAKSTQVRVKKGGREGDINSKEDDATTSEQQQAGEKHLEDSLPQSDAHLHENEGEEHVNDRDGDQKKGRGRGWGKGRGRPQHHQNHNNHHPNGHGHGNHAGTSSLHNPTNELPAVAKQPPGPRMPDGTRGFAMGRGKPVTTNTA